MGVGTSTASSLTESTLDSPLLVIDHATNVATPVPSNTAPVLFVEQAPSTSPAAAPAAVDVKSERTSTAATKGNDANIELDRKWQQWVAEMERRAIESEEKHYRKNPTSIASHMAACREEKNNRSRYYRHVLDQLLKGMPLIEFGFPGPLIDLSATPPIISWPHGRCLAEGRDLDAYPLAMKKFDEKELEVKWREWMCNLELKGEESDDTIDARALFYHETLAKMKQSQSMGPFPAGLPADYNAARTWGEDVTLIRLERLYPRILAYGNLTVTVPEVFEGGDALDAKAYLANAHAADVALKAMRDFRIATQSSEKCDRLYQVMKEEFKRWALAWSKAIHAFEKRILPALTQVLPPNAGSARNRIVRLSPDVYVINGALEAADMERFETAAGALFGGQIIAMTQNAYMYKHATSPQEIIRRFHLAKFTSSSS